MACKSKFQAGSLCALAWRLREIFVICASLMSHHRLYYPFAGCAAGKQIRSCNRQVSDMGAALQLNPARRANSQMQHLHGTFATASSLHRWCSVDTKACIIAPLDHRSTGYRQRLVLISRPASVRYLSALPIFRQCLDMFSC